MKVNHDKKLIFIHIPKCAGGTIGYYFDMETVNKNHDSASVVKQNCDYWSDYTKFTVVRNPWEAELSFFFYRLSKQFLERQELTKQDINKHIEVVLGGFNYSMRTGIQAWDWLKKNKRSGNLYQPFSMMRYIASNEGKNLLNEIIRFENLQNDLGNFCNKYNIEPANELKKVNATEHLHYSNYYTEPMIDYVYKKNKDYIKYFGYEFEKE